jgi:hypothetical protein
MFGSRATMKSRVGPSNSTAKVRRLEFTAINAPLTARLFHPDF